VLTSALFPVFLKLQGRRVLVVGGGEVATAKVQALLQADATVTVVSPRIGGAIANSRARLRRRKFRAADLDGQWLVVSAAAPAVNRAVARAAARRHVFVNAVDDPANASVYLGGVVRRDGVTLAISTDGKAPALAGLLREGLDALLPVDLDRWTRTAHAERRRWKRTRVPMTERRGQLLNALNRLYADRSRERTS
jgi:uroporphyrin-III C-methyltransferase / precorrin-2 dehydrogenase / sirohydrochlorin ferrochelatase